MVSPRVRLLHSRARLSPMRTTTRACWPKGFSRRSLQTSEFLTAPAPGALILNHASAPIVSGDPALAGCGFALQRRDLRGCTARPGGERCGTRNWGASLEDTLESR